MHFDPVASQESQSGVSASRIEPDEFIDREIDQEEGPAPRNREGLPPAFRMRHQRHYVEQLMGDAPIKTVRDIAVADIEPPEDDRSDLQELEQSIRRVGLLQPLLVGRAGERYAVIAGMNRLRAARNAGLRSVPCIVHDVDEAALRSLREAALRRATPPQAEPAPEAAASPATPRAFADVAEGLDFAAALVPVITAAGGDRFRSSVLTDLASIELRRARTVAEAAEALANPAAPVRTDVDGRALVERVLAALAPEARLRGVRLDLQSSGDGGGVPLDTALVSIAVTGFVQSLMAMIPSGATVRVQVKATSIRPALIVQVSQDSVDLADVALERFFEGDWRDHPAGGAGALVLAAAARIARAHGGRVDAQPAPMTGCILTFVVPKPIEQVSVSAGRA